MNTLKKIGFLLIFLFVGLVARAQKDLNIEKIFNDYGKLEGSVLIELAKDVLGNHTRIDRYKSLIIPSDSAVLRATREAVKQDFIQRGHFGNGIVLLESQKDGQIETGTYALGKEDNSPIFEYILFSNKASKMTLIYIKGYFPYYQLKEELDKLKSLFIKVNNKQIKL